MNIRQWHELLFRLDQLEAKVDALGSATSRADADGGGSNPLVLDVLEAAALLRVGRTTVYELMESGDLKSVKIGRRRLVSRASCEELVERSAGRP